MRPLLGRLGGYLPAAIALALPTAFIPNLVDEFILPRSSLVIAGACLGAGVALLTPGGPGLGRLRWPIIAAAAAAIVAFVFSISWPLSFAGSYSRYESLPVRLAYLGLLALPVWLSREPRSRDWVVPAFVFGTAVACLEALAQVALNVGFRPDGNLGNANLLGALIAMAAPLAIARGLHGGRFMVAWWLGLAVMAGGLVATTSRSGALGAIGARPLTGWGEDATGLAFGRFLSGDWSTGVTFDRVHSGPLDLTGMQGLLGLAATGLVLVILFRGAWRWRFGPDVGALAAACAGYTIWVLFNFDWAPATGAFWLLAGTAWSAVRTAESPALNASTAEAPAMQSPALWRTGVAVALAVLAVGLGAFPILADAWYRQGRVELSVVVDPLQARYHWALGQGLVAQGSVAQGIDEMQRASEFGETEPSLYVELGDTEAQLGRSADARRHYLRALEIDPYYSPARQRLAALGS